MTNKILKQNGVLIMPNIFDGKEEYYVSKDGLSLMIVYVYFEECMTIIKCDLQNDGISRVEDIKISINMLLDYLREKGFNNFKIVIEPSLPEEISKSLLEDFNYKDKCYVIKKRKNK